MKSDPGGKKREKDKAKPKKKRRSPRKPPVDFDEWLVRAQQVMKIMQKSIMRKQRLTRSEQTVLDNFMKSDT